MLVRSGTVSISGIVPGFLSVFVDNRGSIVARKDAFICKFPDLKICGFESSPLPIQTAFFEIQFGYEIFIFKIFAAHFTENFVFYNFIKYFPYLQIDYTLSSKNHYHEHH